MTENDIRNQILIGDCLERLKDLPDKSINCCITSPPYYGLRDYGVDGQIGLEESPEAYIDKLVQVFREVKRVLRDDGTLWVNIGDTYNTSSYRKDEKSSGHGKQGTNKGSYENVVERPTASNCKVKDMIGIPWMLAFALRADGWYLRQDIIWHKPNPMPEPIKDRCVKSHEYIFLLSKQPHYYFDYEAIQEESVSSNDPRLNKGRITYEGKRTGETDDDSTNIRFGGNKYGDNDDVHYQTKSGKEWKPQYKEVEDKSLKPQQSFVHIEIVRNKRDVWTVPPAQTREAHFATFPEKLIEPCILAGCPKGGIVLDPFFGSGTTGRVALGLGRDYVGIELNPEYVEIAEKRTDEIQLTLFC